MKHKYFKAFILISFSFLFFSCKNAEIKDLTFDTTENQYTCKYKGIIRSFILCLPKTDESFAPKPLIFMLHGFGENAKSFQYETKFDTTACSRGYGVVYVNAAGYSVKSSYSGGWFYGNDKNSNDDIDFLEALAKFLQQKYNFDKKRTYAIGFSNGAFMCTKLALQKSESFSAIVSVGGMMPKIVWEQRSTSKNKLSKFLQINGTNDDVVPMKKNDSSKYNPNPAIEDVLEYFSGTTSFESIKLSEQTTLYKYSNGVGWCLIQNGNHNWPSEQWSGIKVNNVILDFLEN